MNDLKVARKYISLEQSAKDRGKEFNLSLQSLKNILRAKKCYYTGVPLKEGVTLSIDRVDSSKGYVTGNVVACHITVNHLKSNLSKQDIIKLANKLKQRGVL